jgi:hypothetical protein
MEYFITQRAEKRERSSQRMMWKMLMQSGIFLVFNAFHWEYAWLSGRSGAISIFNQHNRADESYRFIC